MICEGRYLDGKEEVEFVTKLYGDFPFHRIPARVRKKLGTDSVYITKVTKESYYVSMPIEMFDTLGNKKTDTTREVIYNV